MKIISVFLVWVAGTISLGLHASDRVHEEHIRSLVESGRILPLQQILTRYQQRFGGRLLDLEVEREHGRYIYEMEMLTDDGRVIELEVDAADGRLLELEYDD